MRVTIEGMQGGTVTAPPSKSMGHRGLLCAALAGGVSRLSGLGASQDIDATLRAVRALGAQVEYDAAAGTAVVHGAGGLRGAANGGFSPAPGDGARALGGGVSFQRSLHPRADCGCGPELLTPSVAQSTEVSAAVRAETAAADQPHGAAANAPCAYTESAAAFAALAAEGEAAESKATPCAADGGAGNGQDMPTAQTAPLTVDCGESGSTLRFVIPLLALTGRDVRLTGHGRLMKRPQGVYAALFAEKGCDFSQDFHGILLRGPLPAGEYTVDGSVSSQFISGLLFALPLVDGDSVIHIAPPFESRSYVALTLSAMADFGVAAMWEDEFTLRIKGNQQYVACDYAVESDYSQAAFFAVLGAARGSITVEGLRADTMQGDAAILPLLQQAGGDFTREGTAVHFRRSALHGSKIDLADCPDLGPILMVLGALGEGETVITNAGRLRIKESDRIAAMESELRKMGARVHSTADTVTVHGGPLHGCDTLDGHNDHRIVMAMAVAALAAGVRVTLHGAQAVNKSYPGFFEDVARLGAQVQMDLEEG